MKKHKRCCSIWLFLFLASLYLLTMGGHPYSGDGMIIYRLTKSMVEDHAISVNVAGSIQADNGNFYSKYGIGQSLLAIPFYMAGKAIAGFFPKSFEFPVIVFIIFSYNSIISALLGMCIYLLCVKMGYRERLAMVIALLVGLTTMIFPYARYFYTHATVALCIVLIIYFLYGYKRSGNMNDVLIAGIFQGLAVLVKAASIITVPAFLIYILLARGKGLKSCITFLIPLIFTTAFIFYYNFIRFGDILEFGYGKQAFDFSTPLIKGLAGLTVSSGRGIFIYNPILLLSVFFWPAFIRKHKPEGYLFLSIAIIYILFYAKWVDWPGGESWGPRYLIPIIPLLVLLSTQRLADIFNDKNRKFIILIAVFIILSLSIQIIGSVNFHVYNPPWEGTGKEFFNPRYSPIFGQASLLWHQVKNIFYGVSKYAYNPFIDLLDFWFISLSYIPGISGKILAIPLVGLLITLGLSGYKIVIFLREKGTVLF